MGLNPIGVTIIAVRKEKSSLAYDHTTRPTDEGNDKL